jgi:hypothetical protein
VPLLKRRRSVRMSFSKHRSIESLNGARVYILCLLLQVALNSISGFIHLLWRYGGMSQFICDNSQHEG